MIAYIWVKRPLMNLRGAIEVTLYEVCILMTNILVLIMAIFDSYGMEKASERETMGRIIIGCFIIFSVIALVFVALNIVLGVASIYKKYKSRKKGEPITCVDLLTIPFQAGGMEFSYKEQPQNTKTKILPLSAIIDDKLPMNSLEDKGTASLSPTKGKSELIDLGDEERK